MLKSQDGAEVLNAFSQPSSRDEKVCISWFPISHATRGARQQRLLMCACPKIDAIGSFEWIRPWEHTSSRSAKLLLGRDLLLLGASCAQKVLTCRGRSLTSARNLATISPLFGVLAIRPSNTAVYVFEGTASKAGWAPRSRQPRALRTASRSGYRSAFSYMWLRGSHGPSPPQPAAIAAAAATAAAAGLPPPRVGRVGHVKLHTMLTL